MSPQQTRISAKKSSSIPIGPKYTPAPVLQPKATKKPDRQLPEWQPEGGGMVSPLQRLLDTNAVQAKLTIGEPNDKYEQEADAVAQDVVQRLHSPVSETPPETAVQRETEDGKHQLQRKPILQRTHAVGGEPASPDLEGSINRAKGGGQPLDTGLQRSMSQAMGADFSGVRVHTDSHADQLNQSIQAKAFTTGQDVFFRQGAYDPGSRGGQELIAHELTHVVQQGEKHKIQRLKERETQKEISINWERLKQKQALEILQKVASEEYSATPEEMSKLMDIVNPKRGKEVPNVKLNDFSSRMEDFNKDLEKTTYVVPSHAELDQIKIKQDEVQEETGVKLTEDQAWSLVLAELRGKHNETANRQKALKRLNDLNSKWKTSYEEKDLDVILKYLRERTLLATNYFLNKPPGENTGSNVSTETLASLFMKSTTFQQVWETGASQASTKLDPRGAVEESMGYGHALKRTQGNPLKQEQSKEDNNFNPDKREEMPKYAALVSQHQTHGVAPRYGPSVVYWKPDLKNRVTHTPGDSWNTSSDQGALMSFTSTKNPEILFANTDEVLIRLFAAEATGQDQEFLKEVISKGGLSTNAYIETQIHGELTWGDVAEIVVGKDEENYPELVDALKDFASKGGYDFKVNIKSARPGAKSPTAETKPSLSEPKNDLEKSKSVAPSKQQQTQYRSKRSEQEKTVKLLKHRQGDVNDVYTEDIQIGDVIRQYNLSDIEEEAENLLGQGLTPDQVHRELHDNPETQLPHDIICRAMKNLGYENYI